MSLPQRLTIIHGAVAQDHYRTRDDDCNPACEYVPEVFLLNGRESDEEPNYEWCGYDSQDLGDKQDTDRARVIAKLNQVVVFVNSVINRILRILKVCH